MTQSSGEARPIRQLVRELAAALLGRNWRLAAAESCTGGGLGAAITDLPGSSAYFLGGVVAYDNRIKRDLLGVREEEFARHGAVSREVAEKMASGCRERTGADLALSITGIAGPGGASPGKPVGLVFIGVCTQSATRVSEFRFAGDRAEVRRQAVRAALELALDAVRSLDGAESSR